MTFMTVNELVVLSNFGSSEVRMELSEKGLREAITVNENTLVKASHNKSAAGD